MKKILLFILTLFSLSSSSINSIDYKVLNHQDILYSYGNAYIKDLLEPDRFMSGVRAIYYKDEIPHWSYITADRYNLTSPSEYKIASCKSDILYKFQNHKLFLKITDREDNQCVIENIKYIEIIKYRNIF